MPRRKLDYLPGREEAVVNCFAYCVDKSGRAKCRALVDIFCLKMENPCPFFATPGAAADARHRSKRRLLDLEKGDG